MIVDLKHYELSKNFIQRTFLSQKNVEIKNVVSLISAATHVPVIVCYFYIGELLNWPEEILRSINNLLIFYGYEEVTNIPESYSRSKI